MLLCLPCEKIMEIRIKQGKNFLPDLCPACQKKVSRALEIAEIS